jgi:hypothetical protein
MSGKKQRYALRDGMVLEKEFYGRKYRLLVIKDGRSFRFKVGERIFDSLTAAARYVCGDETRAISGPLFWNAPIAD